MKTLFGLLQRIRRDRRGNTIIEFAMVVPVLLVFLMGGFDLGHTLYMQGVLQGTVQKVARDSALESPTTSTLDASVRYAVLQLAPKATVTITRRYYKSFTKAAAKEKEPFTDSAVGSPYRNGKCDNNEPYQDNNNNSIWDEDGADAGQGSAKDDVIYTVVTSYPRLFPINKLIPAMASTISVTATTVLANQPYGDQTQYTSATSRNCP